MNDHEDKRVDYLPAPASRRREDVGARYRARELTRQHAIAVRKPDRAPADQRSWMGGAKESPMVQRHNSQLDRTQFAKEEAEYAIECGVELAYVGVRASSRAAEAMVDTLMSLTPQSLEYAITEQILLDMTDQIRALNADATEGYRRTVLGG